MPRLQILELPEGVDDERPPFVLVIDQVTAPLLQAFCDDMELNDSIAQRIGAQAVLCFEETIDIPANDFTVSDGHTVRLEIEGDFTKFREQNEHVIGKLRDEAEAVVRSAQQRLAMQRNGRPT